MTIMLFSNRKPSPEKLTGESLQIAMTDGALFEQAQQMKQSHYNLAQDMSIVNALTMQQNQRVALALELDKPKAPRPR